MDVTYWYAEDLIERYEADSALGALYNTYETASLPLGPIASPSEEAVKAVLYPENTNDYYFAYDSEGNYYFAETYEEHQQNLWSAGIY